MALIKCKECGNEVSNKARTCPKCGVKVAREPMGCGSVIAIIVIVGVVGNIYNMVMKPSSPASEPAPVSTSQGPRQNTARVVQCDRKAAESVQSGLHDLAAWETNGNSVEVRWGPVWYSKQDDDYRLALLRSFADADACIKGAASEIRFRSPSGKLVGIASPTSGIRVIK